MDELYGWRISSEQKTRLKVLPTSEEEFGQKTKI
jgi:hypothetical protein